MAVDELLKDTLLAQLDIQQVFAGVGKEDCFGILL
jgi:hypothetical protein